MRRPGDKEPEPKGGRAAERLRQFREQRLPRDKAEDGESQGESDKTEPGDSDQGARERKKGETRASE